MLTPSIREDLQLFDGTPLEDGSPTFKQGFTCLVLLENNRNRKLEDFHLPWLTKFHCYCLLTYIDYLWPKSGFARHYYQNLG